ncbi:MAG: nucleotidyl transferase AbiEii/AbiGii toxin family protein [Egibacteraceae bacterium]
MRFEQAKAVLAAFQREEVRYVLVGSMAMAAQGIVRATQDIDFFVAPDAENVACLKRALRSVFDDDSIDEIATDDLAGRYPVIRYGPPDSEVLIDLIGRVGDAFAFEDIEWQALDIDGVSVPVATPRMLYRMKRDTLRPQDRVDADSLRQRFDLPQD